MDAKDLELLTILASDGRAREDYLSSKLEISLGNVSRRIRLLSRSGILKGFSAFIDRRMFGYDTTFVKLHFRMKDIDKVIDEVARMPQVTQVYPNMDDFMLVEVIHWDQDSLMSAIRSMERAASPMTVSAHFEPLFPDEVPELPGREELELLMYLIKDGRASSKNLASLTGMKEKDVKNSLESMLDSGVMEIRPLLQEELVQPFPAFTTMLSLGEGSSFAECFSDVQRIGKGVWRCIPIQDPPGVWLKSFGKDLHAADTMIERYRRKDFVEDVMVVIPDTTVIKRGPDRALVKNYLDR